MPRRPRPLATHMQEYSPRKWLDPKHMSAWANYDKALYQDTKPMADYY